MEDSIREEHTLKLGRGGEERLNKELYLWSILKREVSQENMLTNTRDKFIEAFLPTGVKNSNLRSIPLFLWLMMFKDCMGEGNKMQKH